MQIKANSKRFFNEVLSQGKDGLHLMRIDRIPQSLTTLTFWQQAYPEKTVRVIKGIHREEWSFFPLFPQLAQAFQDLEAQKQEELLEQFVPYPAHKPIFRSVLKGSPYLRLDDLIKESGELHFERQLLYRVIYLLIQELIPSTTLIVIEDFDALSPFFFHWFVWLLKEALPLKLPIFGLINSQAKDLILGEEEKQGFYSLLERHGAFLPFEVDFSESTQLAKPAAGPKLGTRAVGWARAFLAYEDLIQWSEKAIPEHIHPHFAVNVIASYFKGGHWEECQNIIVEFQKNSVDLSAHRWVIDFILSLANHNAGDINMAIDYFEKGKIVLPKALEPQELGFLMVVSSFIEEKLWQSQAMWDRLQQYHSTLEEKCPPYFSLLAKTNLAYFMAIELNTDLHKAIVSAKNTMAQAHSMGNTYAIARLYHMLGYLSKRDSIEKAREYFENGIQLRIQLGHRLGLVKDYNGVGYFYFTTGDFGKSLLYFQKALESLEGEKNYIEIGMTLFNIGQTYFHSGNFSAALEIFQRILDILQIQSIKTMPFHSPLKLNALCCITAFYQNWRSTAAEYWQKLQSFILDPAALPFFYFAKAIYSKMEGNYGLAIQSLEEGIKEATMRDLPHLKFNMELEMYICYGHLHQTHNQKVVIEQIESQLPIHGSFETEKLYQHIRYGGKVENFVSQRRFNSDIRNLSINISNIAKRQATLFNLDRQEKRLKFLSHFVKEISSQYTKSQILKKGAGLIQEEFGFETFILMEDAAEKTWFKGERHHELPEEYAYRQFWSGRTKPQAKSWVSGAIRSAIFPFEAEENNQLWFYAHSTMGNKGFYSEDIDILFLAAEHWNTVLDLRNAKDHNRILVKTDYLTGINARGEILRLAEKERKRCIRYSKSKSRRIFSLLTFDIDYFRQFNEGQGQKEGDKLLKSSAEAFSNLIREFDNIGRIGGDEFLLVLPETDEVGAKVLGDRISESFLHFPEVVQRREEEEYHLGISYAVLQYDIELAPSLDEVMEALSAALREKKAAVHASDSFEEER